MKERLLILVSVFVAGLLAVSCGGPVTVSAPATPTTPAPTLKQQPKTQKDEEITKEFCERVWETVEERSEAPDPWVVYPKISTGKPKLEKGELIKVAGGLYTPTSDEYIEYGTTTGRFKGARIRIYPGYHRPSETIYPYSHFFPGLSVGQQDVRALIVVDCYVEKEGEVDKVKRIQDDAHRKGKDERKIIVQGEFDGITKRVAGANPPVPLGLDYVVNLKNGSITIVE